MKEKPSEHVINSTYEDTDQVSGPAAKGGKKVKGESNAYVPFLTDAIKKMIKSGVALPVVKSATGAKGAFQFKGHSQIWDALQGYWERNRRVYIHAAKVHYRALYLGTKLMLVEEELKSGQNNADLITKLEIWCEEQKSKHAIRSIMQTLRSEARQLVTERDKDIISDQEFHDECLAMVNTFDKKEDQIKFSIMVDTMIEEETVKVANNRYQRKHRMLEKEAKGIHEVE